MSIENMIGREYPTVVWEVQRCKIREMAWALGDENPIYHDAEAAEADGYQDLAPLPIQSRVGLHFGNLEKPIINDLQAIEKPIMAVHAEERYEYLREYYDGDVLTGTPRIADITQKVNKSGGKMRVTQIETMWRNQNGEDVLKVNSTLIEKLAP